MLKQSISLVHVSSSSEFRNFGLKKSLSICLEQNLNLKSKSFFCFKVPRKEVTANNSTSKTKVYKEIQNDTFQIHTIFAKESNIKLALQTQRYI
jgi:hypothetical protein